MARQKVLVTRSNFPPEGIALVKEKCDIVMYNQPTSITREEFLKKIKGCDAVYCHSADEMDQEILNAAGPQLKVIATMSVGYDHIPLEECRKRGIVVCHTPNVSVPAVAEMTVGLLLAVARKIVPASSAIRNGEWTHWDPNFYCGKGLAGSIVGIVGMGRIGKAVTKRILPFDVDKVLYYDIIGPIAEAEVLGAHFTSFENLLQKSDFVLATCSLTESSLGMFNKKAFDLMKTSSVFINTSRGPVVDQESLYQALVSRKISAAGIDVMMPEPLPKDDRLVSLNNIVLLPHIASSEDSAHRNMSILAAKNILSVLGGNGPLTPVPTN